MNEWPTPFVGPKRTNVEFVMPIRRHKEFVDTWAIPYLGRSSPRQHSAFFELEHKVSAIFIIAYSVQGP